MTETKPSMGGGNHNRNNHNAASGTSYSANTFLSSNNSKPIAAAPGAVTEVPPR